MKFSFITCVTGIYAIEDSTLRGRFVEIIISAPKRELRLRCDPNTDEILLSGGSKKKRKKLVPIVTGRFHVEWMWAMTNQQGYSDGFRIQLSAKQRRRVFEFVSIASSIEVYEAKKKLNP